MGVVNVDTKYGPIAVTIKGDSPNIDEVLEINKIKYNTKDYLPKDFLTEYEKKSKGFDVGL